MYSCSNVNWASPFFCCRFLSIINPFFCQFAGKSTNVIWPQGLTAIPTFSFGHPALEKYWYDGIPEKSQVAVCNIIIGKTRAERELRQYAIEGLVRHKHPTTLIVYGRPLTFDPGVEVRFYEGKLSQIKSKTKK